MIKWIIGGLMFLSLIFGIGQQNMEGVSIAIIEESQNAVVLAFSLIGIICLWSGIMNVAEKCGLTGILSKIMQPLLSLLFPGIEKNGKSMQYISLNLVANLLGLGNASTPFGIAAIKALEEEEKSSIYATDNMILFVVMNTASLQIIPTTVVALRLKAGSTAPWEILPIVWVVSSLALVLTVLVTKILKHVSKSRGKL